LVEAGVSAAAVRLCVARVRSGRGTLATLDVAERKVAAAAAVSAAPPSVLSDSDGLGS
jgi:hypothetical protein